MLSEFDIIQQYFAQPGLAANTNEAIRKGIGDDCALLSIPAGFELAISMDTLVENVHFPANAEANLIAYRALAVNLSDLAATGASPLAFTLALTLPNADEAWIRAFSEGLKQCAAEFSCPLVGGDTTRGPLSITIQVHGLVPSGKAITRSGASPGDKIYVSGSLGVAAHALRYLQEEQAMSPENKALLDTAFYRPIPRLTLGSGAAGIVSAGMDISDGLLADLGHLCRNSNTGAEIHLPTIPVARPLKTHLPEQEALALAVTGGDDYELLLTAHPDKEQALLELGAKCNVPINCIGEMTAGDAVTCLDAQGKKVRFDQKGYQHFS